jgi:hypothetical protein
MAGHWQEGLGAETRAFVSSCAERLPLLINSWSWPRSSAVNRTTYFLTAISFPATNHLHRWLAATVIQKLPSFSMTEATREIKNIGASVRARLLSFAKASSQSFELVLTRFARERLLFRLGQSRYADRFVLKGAMVAAI